MVKEVKTQGQGLRTNSNGGYKSLLLQLNVLNGLLPITSTARALDRALLVELYFPLYSSSKSQTFKQRFYSSSDDLNQFL